MLPFDPATLDPEDIGEHRAVLEMDHDEAIEHVRGVFTDAGFGVPVEFSPSEMLNEKVDADRDPYYVLGACNPTMADRALDASDKKLGALFPCNVVVWEDVPRPAGRLSRLHHEDCAPLGGRTRRRRDGRYRRRHGRTGERGVGEPRRGLMLLVRLGLERFQHPPRRDGDNQ